LRQGDAISPLLFSLVLEIATRRPKVETQRSTLDKCRQIMAYAENVVLMPRRLQEIKKYVRHLWKTDKMRLEINKKKQN
jgi:hypothetical protein